ncbi:BREX-1 system adenine-specific DNA-methyltransferase PglX [Chlorobium phaeovibrioides]|uniref:site-specific DNA-methyltransferase (adenine-specific) n=1 Tax=Chlorobium phaeovibrioides TaxID=1094 RepID=A0A5M8I532_CHLPH|nr:BREX-1 system adenine-specific DNA-methyltransferase PglX [Chlorobium phaeovibrioides]
METAKLKKFAQFARRSLMEQVSAKLKLELAENSAARRERPEAIKKLEEAIMATGREQVVERVAYIWFNRFCALRFMDVNRYTRIWVVSPAEGQSQPEVLAEAKMGHIDEDAVPEIMRQRIFALLDGREPSRDPQGEAYRLLVVATCNYWNQAMPFLFERIDDYTELLMPGDLLSGNSILAYTREAMTPDACKDPNTEEPIVEVIGWLYQFYISEKKDEVFDGLKKNKKITPENIPAATQLFTPHWIVRYLVENSLGRLWLLNRPGSKLALQMDYYIKPAQAETDFLRIGKPEEIKICDPACGSGHMLTYAFDLLYAIYEEEGYEPAEIPEKILTNNLYGIEIDERAGELAAFALTMKARAKQRRFFNKGVKPNICVLENVHFDGNELKDYMDFVGRDLFTAPLQTTLRQFEEADNFGSLIRPDVTDVKGMLRILTSKNVSGQLFISMTHQKVLTALRQADYLSPKYHVVIANPPYMSANGMNSLLKKFAAKFYPDSKADLYAMFIQRGFDLSMPAGYSALITMHSWMFLLQSYTKLRESLFGSKRFINLIHLGPRAFPSISGEVVQVSAYAAQNKKSLDNHPICFRLLNGDSDAKRRSLIARENRFDQLSQSDLIHLPGSPFAYWTSTAFKDAFDKFDLLSDLANPRIGLQTGDNERFIKNWHEVIKSKFCRPQDFTGVSGSRWVPHNKGGENRKWYGNCEFIVNWENDGEDIKNDKLTKLAKGLIEKKNSECWNSEYYFKEAAAWTRMASGNLAVRYQEKGFIFDTASPSIFTKDQVFYQLIGLLNSIVSKSFAAFLNPTLSFQSGDLKRIPINLPFDREARPQHIESLVEYGKRDWDSFETSWDFTSLPILNPDYRQPTLKTTYQKLRAHWREMTLEVQQLEQENNRIFIEAYGLQDELKPEVPLNEITLTCNLHYRYGGDKSEDELEALLLADTLRELVSYAVGCMFGRYALDKPGLILANQGETIEDYLKRIPEPSFPADDDNVIPMLDGDWFTDDIAERFRKFLRVAFGEEHYEDNLRFVEQGLNIKGKRNYGIRDYFLGEFYTDHVRRYKKRPIYWLFSSPKGSFNALIYMHRYRPDTVSVVLNDYLREFRTKLTSHKNHLEAVSISASSSQGEKTKALKETLKITKMIAEMEEYEREVLYPLATEQVEIDLDDGVKVNYHRLGAALNKIPGLDAKED